MYYIERNSYFRSHGYYDKRPVLKMALEDKNESIVFHYKPAYNKLKKTDSARYACRVHTIII
jgi:hypothetical protein